jgi:hypothetical protein
MGLVVVVPTAKGLIISCKKLGPISAFNVTVAKSDVVSSFVPSVRGFDNLCAGKPRLPLDAVSRVDINEAHPAIGGFWNANIVEAINDRRTRPDEMGITDGDHI